MTCHWNGRVTKLPQLLGHQVTYVTDSKPQRGHKEGDIHYDSRAPKSNVLIILEQRQTLFFLKYLNHYGYSSFTIDSDSVSYILTIYRNVCHSTAVPVNGHRVNIYRLVEYSIC